jgi:NAD(P)-dependent dehydrogenase (short-subunit alcohol dehydrogenase family)
LRAADPPRGSPSAISVGGGTVVNMASLNATLSFKILPSLAHTTNKAGIIGMTRQLALEGREHGIRANSVSPGLIERKSLVPETVEACRSSCSSPSAPRTMAPSGRHSGGRGSQSSERKFDRMGDLESWAAMDGHVANSSWAELG